MKDLPSVYVSPIKKKFHNNKETYYSKISLKKQSSKNVNQEIDKIFHSTDFVYKSYVEITTKNGSFEETIVGKNGNYLLTINGKKILIKDILEIKKTRS